MKTSSSIPGKRLTMGLSLFYLSFLVLIPIVALSLKTVHGGWDHFWATVTHPRVVQAMIVSFGCALAAGIFNTLAGLVVAWTLVRYSFPFKKIVSMLIDLPFALPTAVAGITLTTLFGPNGIYGQFLEAWGIKVVYTPLGIIVALVFVGFPFVIRTVEPVLRSLDKDMEEASACLGAGRWKTFRYILFPAIRPALFTGFSLAFSRALGEYGSVVFISGNLPFKTETIPLQIISRLEQYDYTGATSIAALSLILSYIILFSVVHFQKSPMEERKEMAPT